MLQSVEVRRRQKGDEQAGVFNGHKKRALSLAIVPLNNAL